MLRSIPLLAMLACVACAGAPVINATPSACSSLLPDSWRSPIESVPLPDGSVVGDWIAAFDGQTGQLDKANSRTTDAIGIVERCEARDRSAVKASRAKFLRLF